MILPPSENNQPLTMVSPQGSPPTPQTGELPKPLALGPETPPNAIDPILSEADLARAKDLLQRYLSAAWSARSQLDRDVARWRRYSRMEKRPLVPWEGAPNVTTPLVRQKVDGIEAHLTNALDLDPFMNAKPYSKDAQLAQQVFETAMERELDANGGQSEIFDAIQDAVVTGTGHIKHIVLVDPTRPSGYTVGVRYVKFENLYVFPVNNPARHRLSYFERSVMPWWEIAELANIGVYDPGAVERIKSQAGATRPPTGERETGGKNVPFFFTDQVDDISRNHEIYECYIRFRPENSELTSIWVFTYHPASQEILSAVPYAWEKFFNYAPYQPIYIKRRAGYYYGDCVPELLEGLQEVADAAFNSELASGQFKLQPLIFVRRGSTVASILKSQKMIPGGVVEVDGDIKDFVQVQDFSPNPFNYQMLSLVNSMAEDATFSDGIIPGDPTAGKRVTATWARMSTSVGSMKLKQYLRNVRDSLNQWARDAWHLIYLYIIRPQGVMEVFASSDGEKRTFLGSQDAVTAEGHVIVNALRGDIQWEIAGGDTVPDKEARLGKLMELLTTEAQTRLFERARADRSYWFLVRMILEAMNIYNWRDYIGATPPEEADKIKELVMQQAQQLAQQEIGKLKEEIKIHLMAKQAAEMEFERQKFGQALAQSSQEPEQGSGQGAGSGGMVSL